MVLYAHVKLKITWFHWFGWIISIYKAMNNIEHLGIHDQPNSCLDLKEHSRYKSRCEAEYIETSSIWTLLHVFFFFVCNRSSSRWVCTSLISAWCNRNFRGRGVLGRNPIRKRELYCVHCRAYKSLCAVHALRKSVIVKFYTVTQDFTCLSFSMQG